MKKLPLILITCIFAATLTSCGNESEYTSLKTDMEIIKQHLKTITEQKDNEIETMQRIIEELEEKLVSPKNVIVETPVQHRPTNEIMETLVGKYVIGMPYSERIFYDDVLLDELETWRYDRTYFEIFPDGTFELSLFDNSIWRTVTFKENIELIAYYDSQYIILEFRVLEDVRRIFPGMATSLTFHSTNHGSKFKTNSYRAPIFIHEDWN